MEIFLLVLALVSMFYLLGPLALMAEQRLPLPHTRRIAPGQAPAPVVRALEQWTSALGDRMSLAGIHELSIPGAAVRTLPLPSVHVLHFVDRDAGVHGLDYVTPSVRWQVFLTLYDGDEEVVTGNAPTRSSFARHPRVHVARMPGVRQPARLRALHDAHARLVMGARVPSPIPPDEALADFVAQHEQRSVERQRELGMMHRRKGVYQPTWKGAFASTWRALPPMLFVHLWREARVSSALWRAMRETRN